MPVCKKCEAKFPFKVMIDGQQRSLRSRSYCLECSPWKQHNTRAITDSPKICPQCGKSNGSSSICSSCLSANSRRKTKERAVALCGGKCVCCGYNRCNEALEFHHLDPSTKKFGISSSSKSWDAVYEEIKKCALVCATCHVEIHCGLIVLREDHLPKFILG